MSLSPVLALFLAACGGSAPADHADHATQNEAPAVEEAPALEAADPAALEADADKKYALVPSPVETQAAVEAAGIETSLATLVTARAFKLDENDTDRVAVRTGVVLADMLLTVKASSNEALVGQLTQIKQGMDTLGAGSDIARTLDDVIARVTAGATSRDELLTELDELSNVVIPELEFNGVARIVPLIQAGSWLEGANLVGKAVQTKGTPSAADGILKQGDVVAYFKDYAKDKSAEAPSVVADALNSTLDNLATIAAKSEPLTEADVATVVSATSSVLSLL